MHDAPQPHCLLASSAFLAIHCLCFAAAEDNGAPDLSAPGSSTAAAPDGSLTDEAKQVRDTRQPHKTLCQHVKEASYAGKGRMGKHCMGSSLHVCRLVFASMLVLGVTFRHAESEAHTGCICCRSAQHSPVSGFLRHFGNMQSKQSPFLTIRLPALIVTPLAAALIFSHRHLMNASAVVSCSRLLNTAISQYLTRCRQGKASQP